MGLGSAGKEGDTAPLVDTSGLCCFPSSMTGAVLLPLYLYFAAEKGAWITTHPPSLSRSFSTRVCYRTSSGLAWLNHLLVTHTAIQRRGVSCSRRRGLRVCAITSTEVDDDQQTSHTPIPYLSPRESTEGGGGVPFRAHALCLPTHSLSLTRAQSGPFPHHTTPHHYHTHTHHHLTSLDFLLHMYGLKPRSRFQPAILDLDLSLDDTVTHLYITPPLG